MAGPLSFVASNAIVWVSYGVILITACAIAFWKRDDKSFLSCNRTQSAIPLAFNFVASALGCGIFTGFPQIANIAGIQGLLVYSFTGAIPMFTFAILGPMIRKKVPKGFVLTEWVYARYGVVAGLYLSACTILTIFLFMVSEAAALKYAIETLTSIKALPVIIVECIITTIYTTLGGFKISFITDNLQISLVMLVIVIVSCAMGGYTHIDTEKIASSGLLNGTKLGWQLVYILTVAIVTNDFFMAGFWLRAFASKSDKDLRWGCTIAFFLLSIITTLVGIPGLIAVWAGDMEVADPNGSAAFFVVLAKMPPWVSGFVTVFVTWLSTCTMDSLQSAMVSTISNDVFRNKLPLIYVRGIVVLIMFPVVVVGLKAQDVLQIYLIVDLLASAVIPILMLGLSHYFDFLSVWEIVSGGLGGLLGVFIFGSVYFDSTKEGGKLLLIWNGLYGNDWSAFGAFVVAPFGGLAVGFFVLLIRTIITYIYCKSKGIEFDMYKKKFVYENSEQESIEVEEQLASEKKSAAGSITEL